MNNEEDCKEKMESDEDVIYHYLFPFLPYNPLYYSQVHLSFLIFCSIHARL